jgi:hypothetical protein
MRLPIVNFGSLGLALLFYFHASCDRLMASVTQSRIGRRDAKTISARILMGIVRVLDFALLLIAAFGAADAYGVRPRRLY